MPAPADLVHQTSTSTGTGNLTLASVNGKRTFDTAFSHGSTTDVLDYFISNQGAAEWERGTGHMSDSTTLVRDTVLASSNSNNAVSFSAGTKDVTNDVPAAKQMYIGQNATLDNIDLILAELAMMQADALSAPEYLGESGNIFADSFDTTTSVDTAGATNLDTGTAGQLKPSTTVGGNDSFTKVLLHCDGSDASTTFTDSCAGATAHTWTASGNAQVDTAQSKFGGASLLCDGTGDYISAPDSADFNLGTGDWTIDCWINRNGGSGTRRFFFGQVSSTGAANISCFAELTAANVVKAYASTDGTTQTSVTGTTAITTTGWHHVAFVRTSGVLKLFIDGTQEGGDVSLAGTMFNSTSDFSVGRAGELTSLTWNGWVDEFRISVGVARWTSNFTPVSAAYNAPATNNLTVASTALTADAVPTKAKGFAMVEETDSITLNTDYKLWASRDSGTTYTAFSLTKMFTRNSIAVYASAELDISGQPSGSAPKWKITTANNKMAKTHAVELMWR